MGLSKEWTDHIKDKEKKLEFEQYIRNSGSLLDRLIDIIDIKVDGINRSEVKEDYSSPSWPMLQADRIGQLKAFRLIKNLLDREGIN